MDEYNKNALKDLEIKIHDARRQIEKLIDLEKTGQPLPDKNLESLASALVQALQYFYDIRNGAEKVLDEIEIETESKSNVVGIFSREDK